MKRGGGIVTGGSGRGKKRKALVGWKFWGGGRRG